MIQQSDHLQKVHQLQRVIKQSPQNDTTAYLQLQANAPMDYTSSPVQKKKNQTGLPDQLKSGIEQLSGIDMSNTRVHYNSAKPAQLQAQAYAQGDHIHVAPGQEKHVPHEAWHVVQQKQGRVQPTRQLKKKIAINDDKGLEHEADRMGAKAMQYSVQQTTENLKSVSRRSAIFPIQRIKKNKPEFKGKRVEDHAHKGTIIKPDHNGYWVLFDNREVVVLVLADELEFINENDVDIDAKLKLIKGKKNNKKKKKNNTSGRKNRSHSTPVMSSASYNYQRRIPPVLPNLIKRQLSVKHNITYHGNFKPAKNNSLYKKSLSANAPTLINFVVKNKGKFFYSEYEGTFGDTYQFHLGFDTKGDAWFVTVDYYEGAYGSSPYGIITHFGPFGHTTSVSI